MKPHNWFATVIISMFIILLSGIAWFNNNYKEVESSQPESNIVTYYMPDNVRCYGYTSHTSTIACVVLEPINNDER